MANQDGTRSEKLVSAPGPPYAPRWSPDGLRLRLEIVDYPQSRFFPRWELRADGTDLHRVLSAWPRTASGPTFLASNGTWTPDGRYYVFVSDGGGGALRGDPEGNVWAVREKVSFLRRAPAVPVQLTAGPIDYTGVVPGVDGRKLFVMGQQRRGELVRWDVASGQAFPFLSGISAEQLDFSRDGAWAAYVSFPDGALWRSRANGEEPQQLTSAPLLAAVPRWSPDGRRIALMARKPGDPWNIHVIPADGGALERPLPQDFSQEDPNWAPDGRSMVFALQSAPGVRDIRVLDLNTGQVQVLAGSEGLRSPRWSPSGRHLVALSSRSTDVGLMLYDFESQKWMVLYEEGVADWPSWTRDGTAVYFWATPRARTDATGVYRIRISDRRLERVASAPGFASEGAWSPPWWGLAPDGALLTLRSASTWGIYAFDWEAP